MAKGLDQKFLHYGIRKEDLELIRTLVINIVSWTLNGWAKIFCKSSMQQKVDKIEMSDIDTESIISSAIQQIKQ